MALLQINLKEIEMSMSNFVTEKCMKVFNLEKNMKINVLIYYVYLLNKLQSKIHLIHKV